MSFADALFLIAAVSAVLLALICWHLLGRVVRLEKAIAGGLTPPSRRLSREEFDSRFAAALARRELATEIGSGVVLALAPDDDNLRGLLANLSRADGVHLAADGADAAQALADATGHRFSIADVGAHGLSIPSLPWLWLVDDGVIRRSEPVLDPSDLVELLRDPH